MSWADMVEASFLHSEMDGRKQKTEPTRRSFFRNEIICQAARGVQQRSRLGSNKPKTKSKHRGNHTLTRPKV